MNIRNHIFWIVDFIKGGKISKHYKDIESILKNPSSESSMAKRSLYLNRVLDHATKTTKFYGQFKDYKSICDFPIIKKTIVQDNFEDFKSQTCLKKKCYKVSTSGSTGVPFFLFHNKSKRLRNTADVIYFSKLAKYQIGYRLYELEVWREHNKKNKIKSWMQNVIQFDVSKLTDKRIEIFINKLKKYNGKKAVLGFASSLEMISVYLDRLQPTLGNLNLVSFIASSEYLNNYTKTALEKHFNAPVFSRYSSEEIGIVAQQTSKSPNSYIINHASYFIELLQLENDQPAKIGDFGRIVITDLYNYSMPLIRYDTGDIAKTTMDNKVLKFEQIEGRKMDIIYDCDGNIVSSFVVYTKFYKYYHLLKQYQFIQEGEKEYIVKLNILDSFPFENELKENIKKDFGKDALIRIEYVDEIPLLSSGKRKKVVNNYKN